MFPVLQPSMCEVEIKAVNNSDGNSNDDGNGNEDNNGNNNNNNNEDGDGDVTTKRSKNTIFNGDGNSLKNATTIASKTPLLHHLQSRIRASFMRYRRHRHFRRSLVLLWAAAVLVSISANWLAWTGGTNTESFLIATTKPIDICFVTAQYASSTEQLDNLVDLRQEAPTFFSDRHSDHYHFFAFTNRRDWIEKASQISQTPKTSSEKIAKENGRTNTNAKAENNNKDNGWTILVKEFPPQTFQRFITQSRWPKFQGFRHERILQSCQVVFYMDGTVLPVGSPWQFQSEARRILNSKVQLSQELHPHADEDGGGIAGEMERCRVKKKDIESNLKATSDWFHAQPDFTNDCQMYQNTFFGYAVHSASFRMAADFAWGRFSLETDSWRDQPLWCYTLHHFGITPLIIPQTLFEYQARRKGSNDHKYDESANSNAQLFYEGEIGKTSTANAGASTNNNNNNSNNIARNESGNNARTNDNQQQPVTKAMTMTIAKEI
mmetsp:Transcript_4779/g.10510  ORF Transcript_4779/g.10510 Transcript_4779/m.10510 type:complete len:492 (+) Transcript_4779:204-1679(+)|eukprot:CAMPEP_0168193450 /NCGR_PEP_ID=MMETSP0139_2-20121125/18615_1 /TAXON_ID=44445 /ORGANISM="Pseudo-nitzschia australis, Strain 10249 10 AB" /LENGTH=491 /DNA_ID=CAMNT_0008116811 /DNA_START=185 /DNA_END=1660 /DNA_ORIENTATION=-